MRIPGFPRRERAAVADPAAGQVYVERRPGESTEAFEMRLAAAARERAGERATFGAREGRPPDRPVPERQRRRRGGGGLGLIGALVVLVAVLGALWIALAAREGSFAAGGAVVDRKLAEVSAPARVAADHAVEKTGAAVQSAGQALENQGERIRDTAH